MVFSEIRLLGPQGGLTEQVCNTVEQVLDFKGLGKEPLDESFRNKGH